MVWAFPRSIATTKGITIVFFSSAYLDVSVQRVRLQYYWITRSPVLGCPIRKSADQQLFAPPHSLSQLITSFFASESQGILRTPLLTFLLYTAIPGSFSGLLPHFPLRTALPASFFNLSFLPACQWTYPFKGRWRIRESNPWPLECKSSALANWANPPIVFYFNILWTVIVVSTVDQTKIYLNLMT